ncbi:hypothetical protein KFE25_004032 [Diacronema lutheri]|uniref:Fe2OG dioxygenase domain-containing protein n=1 Tax=Diacronema lutheri TaxID=2081491 RepID=A0A8J5XNH8_DIALT|nr:hypothetical protein KFE25_004032 [Diacronema lutheri]
MWALLFLGAAPLSARGAHRAATAARTAMLVACAPGELTVGAAIERAACADEVLAAAARIPAPGPPFAAAHLADDVHQRRRQRLACNALQRLAALLIGSGNAYSRSEVMLDERFSHAAQCAAAPSCARADGADDELDATSAREVIASLAALAALCGEDAVARARAREALPTLAPLRAAALALGARAERLSPLMRIAEACSARHALRRLVGRTAPTPRLDEAVRHLPFDIAFGAIALPAAAAAAASGGGGGETVDGHAEREPAEAPSALLGLLLSGELSVDCLLREVPFAQSELLTADGRRVRERRHTAWLADNGIGALAYSGKLMPPAPMPPSVRRVRDALHLEHGELFDCALCNLYPPGGEAACKWHTDPEHGTRWALPTSVVAVGDTRRFAFRPLRPARPRTATAHGAQAAPEGAWTHVLPLFSGDVVHMVGACNDEYEHAVLPGEGERNAGARISLVFKRALVCGGRRGHGLAGEGRRARARLRDTSKRGGDLGSTAAREAPRPRASPAAHGGGPSMSARRARGDSARAPSGRRAH